MGSTRLAMGASRALRWRFKGAFSASCFLFIVAWKNVFVYVVLAGCVCGVGFERLGSKTTVFKRRFGERN